MSVAEEPADVPVGDEREAACSCGSGVAVTKLSIDGQTVELLALPLIFRHCREKGLGQDEEAAHELFATVKIYNAVPPEAEAVYRNAIMLEYAAYCRKETQVTGLLVILGECPEVAEEKLETYALFTARGPTYFWFQFYELLRFAETSGLTVDEAQRGLLAMVAGALKTMTAAGLDREEVMNLIPVKAPCEMEVPVTEVFRKQLPLILEQIKP